MHCLLCFHSLVSCYEISISFISLSLFEWPPQKENKAYGVEYGKEGLEKRDICKERTVVLEVWHTERGKYLDPSIEKEKCQLDYIF